MLNLKENVEKKLKSQDKGIWQFVNDEAKVFPLTARVESITGIPAAVQVGLGLGFTIFQALNGAYAELIAICFGTLYPMFKSVQALQTEDDPDDDKVWLTYWVLYGTVVALDQYASFILEIIPRYYLVKLGLFIWLQIPGRLMGAKILYKYIFAPIYSVCGPTLQYYVNRTQEDMYDFNK